MVRLAVQVCSDLIVGLALLKLIHDPYFLINRNYYHNSTIVFMSKAQSPTTPLSFPIVKIYFISNPSISNNVSMLT